uniref:Solute carrier family 40 member n=1 Tax=Parastrongyloides trichosuri TaxID=131310 RepID=A0A0N4ZR78_PARTI
MMAENFVTKRSFYLFYTAYGISCFGDRMWSFAVSLLMVLVGGLKLIGLYQLIDGLSSMIFSSFIGVFLDKNERNFGIQVVLAFNNLSVVISSISLYFCLAEKECNTLYFVLLFIALFFNAVSNIASGGEKLAFSKDWIVVLSEHSNGKFTLADSNSKMHIIDQAAAMLSPLIVGYMLTFQSYETITIILACWNLFSWIIEFILLKKLYNSVPHLKTREHSTSETEVPFMINTLKHDKEMNKKNNKKTLINMLRTYFEHPIFLSAFALALLYFTVLGSDGLGIGYAKTLGLPEVWIGYSRFMGSALGVGSALMYPIIQKCIGTRKTGFLGFVLQVSCLSFCIISIFLTGSPFDPIEFYETFNFSTWFYSIFSGKSFINMMGKLSSGNNDSIITSTETISLESNRFFNLPKNPLSVLTFLFGIISARFGLWLIDISITQLMQENVPEETRSTVFGVQLAICNAFSVFKDLMVLIFPDIRTFGFLIIISYLGVISAFICYSTFLMLHYFKKRNNSRTETKN